MGDRVSNMVRPIIAIVVLLVTFNATPIGAQESVSFKNFTSFKQVVPGIDFFASNKQEVAPYEKPVADAISRLRSLLGDDLPKGAVFICSTLAQKDSVYEPKVLKSGYSWTLTAITPQARMQDQLARMKSQNGTQISPEMLERIKSRMSETAGQSAVNTLVQQVAYAILQTSQNKELQYRSSRIEDVKKSPLPDWLDIGIVSYACGSITNLSYLQQHIEETFPLDDVLSMSRPFVGSSASDQGRGGGMGRGGNGNGGGSSEGMAAGGFGGMSGGMPGGMPAGGFGGMSGGMPAGGFGGFGGGAESGRGGGTPSGRGGVASGSERSSGASGGGRSSSNSSGGRGQRGGMQGNMSKDEQDRMLFDGQASTFFAYLVDKIGLEKVKKLIKEAQGEKSSYEYLTQADVFGTGYTKVENDWTGWVKAQQAPPSGSWNPGLF
jgi:hypothetical protein